MKLIFSLMLLTIAAHAQTITLSGKVSTATGPVKFASLSFVDNNDTSRKFTAMTDVSGEYRMNIPTWVTPPSILPAKCELEQNYPNPFSSSTSISYKLNQESSVSVKVYNVLGQLVKEFRAGSQSAGVHGIIWDGTNELGRKVSPGVYFCQLNMGNQSLVRKMLFGFQSGAVSTPTIARLSTKRTDVQIPMKIGTTGGTFRVRIENSETTQPQIAVREFYGINVQQDTAMDFTVREATHYNMNLYVTNWGYDQVYVVDADRDAVVDTLTGFRSVGNVVPTKSGKKLYVTTMAYSVYPYDTTYPASVYSVDLATKLKNNILTRRAMICLEPNGAPLIVASSTTRDTALDTDTMRVVGTIDTVTDAISFFDTLNVFHGTLSSEDEALVFAPDEPVFYTFDNQNRLFAYNYRTRTIVRHYTSLELPYNMVISKDGKKIYCANGPVLDVARDSIVGWVTGNTPSILGTLALAPDGIYLYLTDPAKTLLPEPVPSGKINVFNTDLFGYMGFIDVNPASGQASTMTNGIAICPDGSKAFVTGSFADIFVLDLTTNQVVDMIKSPPRNTWLRSLALGAK